MTRKYYIIVWGKVSFSTNFYEEVARDTGPCLKDLRFRSVSLYMYRRLDNLPFLLCIFDRHVEASWPLLA